MSIQAIVANGAMHTTKTKLNDDSDKYIMAICRLCKEKAFYNMRGVMAKCKKCDNSTEIDLVEMPWIVNVFIEEVRTVGIAVKIYTGNPMLSKINSIAEKKYGSKTV